MFVKFKEAWFSGRVGPSGAVWVVLTGCGEDHWAVEGRS